MRNLSQWKWGRIFLVLFAAAIALNLISSYYTKKVYADTTGWVDAAIDAKDISIIIEKLEKAKAGMQKWGALSGNAYLLYGDPQSDLMEVNKNLGSYIARAQELEKLDKASKEYHDGLTDLNESFYDLYLYADDYWLRHNGIVLFVLTSLVELAVLLSLVAMFGYYFTQNQRLLRQAVDQAKNPGS